MPGTALSTGQLQKAEQQLLMGIAVRTSKRSLPPQIMLRAEQPLAVPPPGRYAGRFWKIAPRHAEIENRRGVTVKDRRW